MTDAKEAVAAPQQAEQVEMEVDTPAGAPAETTDDVAGDEPQEEVVVPYTISVYLPDRPLLPANAAAMGIPEPPLPLQITLGANDTLNDIRATLTDNHEGYWLGAYCFRRPVKVHVNGDSKSNGKTSAKPKLGDRLCEWVELKTIFGEDEDRTVYVTHVQFNSYDARQHVVRFREILSGAAQDPSSLGVEAGLSVHDAIRHKEEWIKETQPLAQQQPPAGKSKKGAKKDAENGAQTSDDTASSPANPTANPFASWEGWTSSSMCDLIPEQARKPRPTSPCLRHLAVAQWNPPPQHLRLQGHHFYLHVVTLENETLYITACTDGFYISNSTSSSFNPTPRAGAASYASASLYDLLCAVSPLFLANFAKLFQDPLSTRDFHSILPITNCLAAFPWLVRKHAHTPDAARSQLAYLLTGAVSADTLDGTRDWNEELQSMRELPRATLSERVLRDRFLNRTYAEFVAAAARAVPRVASGEIQSMNPNDKLDAQMYVCNNLFISKGVDGSDVYPHLGGDEAAHVAVGKDLAGVRVLNTLDVPGVSLLGTAVVDWKGERWVVQTIVPGLFRRHEDPESDDEADAAADKDSDAPKPDAVATDKPTESKGEKDAAALTDTAVVYGGVDGPEVIRSNPVMHKAFGKLAASLRLAEHEITDAKGVKHNLWTSLECKGLQAADGRRYALDLARLNPVDIEWLEQDLKGNACNASTDAGDYPHRLTLLRPELLEIYWDTAFRQWTRNELEKQEKEAKAQAQESEGKEADVAAVAERRKINPDDFKLSFNPDAFVEYKFGGPDAGESGEVKVLVSDESDPSVAAVRSASKHLRDVAIPRLISDAAAGMLPAMDGQALTTQLHLRGINVRYLGQVAHLCEPSQKDKLDKAIVEKLDPGYQVYLDTLRYVCEQEMAIRAAKRVLRDMLREARVDEQANAVSHLLNCLFGFMRNPRPEAVHRTSPLELPASEPEWTQLTPASLRSKIVEQVSRRYRYVLPESFIESKLLKKQALRALCLKTGIQLQLREYDLGAVSSVANGTSDARLSEDSASEEHQATETKTQKKKRKAAAKHGGGASIPTNTTFTPEDVVNLVPLVKDSTPKSQLPEEALEAGRACLVRGDRDVGVELMHEGITFAESIYGGIHPEISRVYAQYASTVHSQASIIALEGQRRRARAQAEGKEVEEPEVSPLVAETLTFANALKLQRLAVTVGERTVGLDAQDTLFQWVNLSVMERMNGNVREAMLCQQRALELWDIIHGREHPESIQCLMQIAQTLQGLSEPTQGSKVFQTVYNLTRKLFGTESINTAQAAYAMAETTTLAGDLKAAIGFAKEAFAIYEARLGKEDEQTKDTEQFLSALTAAAVRHAKAEKDALERQRAPRARIGQGLSGGPRFALRPTQRQPTGSAANGHAQAGPSSSSSADAALDAELSERLAQLPVSEIVKYIQGETSGSKKASGSGRRGKGRANAKPAVSGSRLGR